MNNLKKALHDHELLVLRIIGEWWELDLTGSEKLACVNALAEALGRLDMQTEIKYLPSEEATALYDLIDAGGRMPVAAFERQHGEVRQMGPGRLEREEPWLDPVSPAEALWYRGFVYRAFEEFEDGELVEYYYLPDELFEQFPGYQQPDISRPLPGSLAFEPVPEPDRPMPESIDAVDDLTAMLAAAQVQAIHETDLTRLKPLFIQADPQRASLLFTLGWEMQLLRPADEGMRPTRQIVDWLQKSREEQLRELADAWSQSSWNELNHTPGILCEGSGCQNEPILARTALLDALPRSSEWYRLSSLLNFIKDNNPDFQRPDGNYDTWYIRDIESDGYLTGFQSWDYVEGRLLRFLIQGPMAWLGLVETGLSDGDDELLFRLTTRAIDWLADRPAPSSEVSVPIVVHDDATISVPHNANRYHRFQIARVAEAGPAQPGKPFFYRLTPATLDVAREQGIAPQRLLTFLSKASGRPLPPSTKRAVERWAERGVEARLEDVVLLRVKDAEILDKLRANPKTRLYIGESMGDLAAVVRRGDWQKLRLEAATLGLLIDHRS